mmetsp:Transcript_20910/g.30754  ORF Transcript_20910/g.30754 Transcript_20910/m.30754 type:complete len:163 (+) Transcript_20910:574-1062(+)
MTSITRCSDIDPPWKSFSVKNGVGVIGCGETFIECEGNSGEGFVELGGKKGCHSCSSDLHTSYLAYPFHKPSHLSSQHQTDLRSNPPYWQAQHHNDYSITTPAKFHLPPSISPPPRDNSWVILLNNGHLSKRVWKIRGSGGRKHRLCRNHRWGLGRRLWGIG